MVHGCMVYTERAVNRRAWWSASQLCKCLFCIMFLFNISEHVWFVFSGGLLFAVNGPTFDGHNQAAVGGFTISLSDSEHSLLDSWNLPTPQVQCMESPVDVAVDVMCGIVLFQDPQNPLDVVLGVMHGIVPQSCLLYTSDAADES